MKNFAMKESWIWFAFLTLIFWIPSAAMAGATLSGTVRNVGFLTISQATVTIYGWNASANKEFLFASVKTDTQGKFRFDSLPREGSSIAVAADGYRPYTEALLYPPTGNTVWDIQMQSLTNSTPGPTMTGTVRNKVSGLPVNQATLSIYGWHAVTNKEYLFTSAKTDVKGNYKFDSLPPEGDGTVDVTLDGYKTFHQVVLYPPSGNTIWNYDLEPVSTAIGNLGRWMEGNALTWRPLPGGNILFRYPLLHKEASLRGYLPSGEMAFQEILPAQSRERVINPGSGNIARYYILQLR